MSKEEINTHAFSIGVTQLDRVLKRAIRALEDAFWSCGAVSRLGGRGNQLSLSFTEECSPVLCRFLTSLSWLQTSFVATSNSYFSPESLFRPLRH